MSRSRDEHQAGGFPEYDDVDPPAGFIRFVTGMRKLQDLAVSVDPGETGWDDAARRVEELVGVLEGAQVPEGHAPAGRAPKLPGMGSVLLPPFITTRFGPDGVTMEGQFTRFHVGGNSAVHGGVLPLLFDNLFGMVAHAAGRFISRTAFLHVDYRNVTPIDTPLKVCGRVDNVEGRKAFLSAELSDNAGTVLADANGLMVRLLPGQP